jgi:hypothetical protein
MLRLLEEISEKRAAQKKLQELLRDDLPTHTKRTIGWPGGNDTCDVYHDKAIWTRSYEKVGETTPRYWNAFGIYFESGSLDVCVEINIPTTTNTRKVAGFFAADENGTVYLMHSGGIGGGKKGVGKTAFLASSRPRLVDVVDHAGEVRLGLIVAPLIPRKLGAGVARFVMRVADFRKVVQNKDAIKDLQDAGTSYDAYLQEFSGKKRGNRAQEFEYMSWHGEIVDAIYAWRKARALPNEVVANDVFRDLYVRRGARIRELYEVKTSVDRQSIYTGLGQLSVHGGQGCVGILVIPAGDLPTDIVESLERLKIRILRFSIKGRRVRLADDFEL